VEGLQADDEYRFAVVAFDGAGNESLPSNPWYTGAAPPQNVRQIQSAIPVSGSVAQGAWQFFRITVPVESVSLEAYTGTASGNVDLYLKKGSKPGASDYDYRSNGATGSEKITVASASTPRPLSDGEWYLGVYGKQKATFSVGATTSGGSPCTLTCTAAVPLSATPASPVSFQGSASIQDCPDAVAYTWTFGDKTAPVTNQSPFHGYAGEGTYLWTLTAVSGSVGCIQSGSIVISTTAPVVPGAPTIGTATAGNARATVAFTPPASDGGSPITGYTVTSSPGERTGEGASSPITVTGLTNGTAYTFTVKATNAVGKGPASAASNSVTPGGVPGAPTIGKATAGNAQATVTFTPPASDGGSPITGNTVTSSPGGKTGAGASSPITVTGLANGTAYTFTVKATNAVGTGPASAASNSVTPAGVPGAPTIGTATAGNAQATVAFTPPASDGGSPITGYTATSNPGGKTGESASSSITVTDLTNGTAYTFTVRATNAVGTGPASAASNSVTPGGEYGWRPETRMPTGTEWAGSAVANSKLYVIGGGSGHDDKISVYSPSAKTWSQKTVGSMGFLLRAATLSNMIYIFDTSDPEDPGWIYNPTTKILAPMGGTPPNLEWTSEPAVYNGKVYFFGGYGPLKTTWEFDPSTLVYTKKADMPTAGYGSSTAVLNGKIYVIGGNYRYNKIEIYNPKTDTWAPSLSFSSLNLLGWDTAAPVGGKIAIVEATKRSTFLFDPATRKLTAKVSMPRVHGKYLTGEGLGGRLYVAGGEIGPRLLDSFGPAPAKGSVTRWIPLSDEEVTEALEPDCRAVEAEHLRRVEEISQGTAGNE
jgi:hypothetical protein